MKRPIRTMAALASAALVLTAATCSPPPSTTPVPSAYPPCVGSPTCLVINGGGQSTLLIPVGTAISDDGRVMATTTLKKAGDLYTTTLALVGIDDRWYREVAVTGPGSNIDPGQVAMTPAAGRVAFVTQDAITTPAFPIGGLFIYDSATKQVTRPSQPAGFSDPAISDDGLFVVGRSAEGVVVVDVASDSYQVVEPRELQWPTISGNGRYVAWSTGRLGSTIDGQITRYDRTSGSTVDLPPGGAAPSLSRDGSRVATNMNPTGRSGDPDVVQYADVGDAAWTVLPGSGHVLGLRLSSDGTHLVYGLTGSDPLFAPIYDADLIAATSNQVASFGGITAISPNGRHVLYDGLVGTFRWGR
jgi:hypothetical protein